jgi:Na+-driven multidrug efflux pump
VAAVYLVSAPKIISLFLSEESAGAISSGAYFIRWVSPFYAVIVVKVMLDSVFRGIGRMKLFMASTLAGLFLRVGLVYAFAPFFSLEGIGYAWDIGWVAATLLAFAFYVRLKKARESDI